MYTLQHDASRRLDETFDDPAGLVAAGITLVTISVACTLAFIHRNGGDSSSADASTTRSAAVAPLPTRAASTGLPSSSRLSPRSKVKESFFDCSPEQYFKSADTNGNGKLSQLELKIALRSGGLFGDEVNALFEHLDTNNDGHISLEEFVAAVQMTPELKNAIAAGGPPAAAPAALPTSGAADAAPPVSDTPNEPAPDPPPAPATEQAPADHAAPPAAGDPQRVEME